ncbi:MAG: DUF7346 family protein [Natronomonas sp.]
MRIVKFEGDRYLLLKRSTSSSLVYDPVSGDRRYLPNHELNISDVSGHGGSGESFLNRISELGPLGSITNDATLEILFEIETNGPLPARVLLDRFDRCESDLHGIISELRAAELVTEIDLPGGRGYQTTTRASEALDRLR